MADLGGCINATYGHCTKLHNSPDGVDTKDGSLAACRIVLFLFYSGDDPPVPIRTGNWRNYYSSRLTVDRVELRGAIWQLQ